MNDIAEARFERCCENSVTPAIELRKFIACSRSVINVARLILIVIYLTFYPFCYERIED